MMPAPEIRYVDSTSRRPTKLLVAMKSKGDVAQLASGFAKAAKAIGTPSVRLSDAKHGTAECLVQVADQATAEPALRGLAEGLGAEVVTIQAID